MNIRFVTGIIRSLSGLLKSIWTFFPSLLFLFLSIFCFWLAGQGKDIIIAFTEKRQSSLIPTRIIFFLGIGFWVYVTWYSSRVIAYIKQKRQQIQMEKAGGITAAYSEQAFQQGDDFFDVGKGFLDEFPRFTGNACFLVLELAVLQLPTLTNPIHSTEAFIIFFLALIGLYFIDRWISDKWSRTAGFGTLFWVIFILFFVLLLVASIPVFFPTVHVLVLLGLLLLLHVSFIFYINLRRAEMERKAEEVRIITASQQPWERTLFERIMDYFCIPRVETGYFKWFLRISIVGVLIYVTAVYVLGFARGIGPFPILILAFAVLLAFGNIVTAFSVRYRINFHFLIFLFAFFIGMKETHYVRTIDIKKPVNYAGRTKLDAYLKEWLNERIPLKDTTDQPYDIYFVLADGGASRSGYWTTSVLGRLEDSSLNSRYGRFSDHLFCLSGTSGGGVGVATFFSLLRDKKPDPNKSYVKSAADFLSQDYFSFTLARMLGPDFFNYIFPVKDDRDRGAALEESLEESARILDSSDYPLPFYDTLSKFTALDAQGRIALPILFVNTTRMQDGNPGVVTNLLPDPGLFNDRVDVLGLLDSNSDISIASGAILGARFPYLSPAGRIGNDYFVDGGYFDNSGAGVVQEIIRGIMNMASDDSAGNGPIYRQVRRLHFKVLHIVNGMVGGEVDMMPVAPIKNDLFAPLLTMVGAYDMQTTVNDSRLINYIKDINGYMHIKADYTMVSLYEDYYEWMKDPLHGRFDQEPSYSMNWFMSDTTRRRIDNRLDGQPVLKDLIRVVKE